MDRLDKYMMKTCPKCGAIHEKSGKFCSRSCANSRPKTVEQRIHLSKTLSGKTGHDKNKGRKLVQRIKKCCDECGEEFETKITTPEKYCSVECSNKNFGGYRDGSGRAKTGYYKGIYCGSTYELAWVIYQLDHKNEFERFTGFLEFNGRKYFPDFIQDGKIVEIKGYESQESVDVKNNIARENGYEVIVLRKDDLQKEFDWVKENYSKDFKTLYDEYKPKYNYVCVCCDSPFSRDKPINAKHITCSRSCSLKMNRKVSGNNQYTHREAAGVATSPSN